MPLEKHLYEVEAWVPVTIPGDRIPVNYSDYKHEIKKGKFGYGIKKITVPAFSDTEAGEKVMARLNAVYGDLPNAKPYIEYGGGIDNNEPLRGLGIELQYKKNKKDYAVSDKKVPANRVFDVKYIDFNDLKEPFYVLQDVTNLGIVLTFNEIFEMVKNNRLPNRFIENPSLIPRTVYQVLDGAPFLRDHREDPSKWQEIIYSEEELDPKIQARIIEGLLNHEEDNARGFQLDRDLPEHIKDSELFPEETFFWSYHPETNNPGSGFYSRFRKLCYYWINDYLYAGHVVIGTKSELEDCIRTTIQTEIIKNAQEIRRLANLSEQTIKSLREWPK